MVREAESELGRGVEEKLELNRFERAFYSLLCRHRHIHTQTDLLADGWIYGWIEGWMYLATWPIFSWGKERFSI